MNQSQDEKFLFYQKSSPQFQVKLIIMKSMQWDQLHTKDKIGLAKNTTKHEQYAGPLYQAPLSLSWQMEYWRIFIVQPFRYGDPRTNYFTKHVVKYVSFQSHKFINAVIAAQDFISICYGNTRAYQYGEVMIDNWTLMYNVLTCNSKECIHLV